MPENQIKTKNKINNIYKTLAQVVFLALFFIFIKVSAAQAATLYISPSVGNYDVGGTISTTVYVSSNDQSVNALSGTLSYPTDKLEVTAIDKASSVINLWVQEPSYSNTAGTISFEGISLNPGYKGTSGKIINITFRIKSSGEINIRFSTGSVLANDGQGTNILASMGAAKYVVKIKETIPVIDNNDNSNTDNQSNSTSAVASVPYAPIINSDTHPDTNLWYNNNTPRLHWNLSADIQASRLLISLSPQATPSVNYSPAISSKTLGTIDDGIWYFHVALKNVSGWGNAAHYRLQIDTIEPEYFNIEEMASADKTISFRKFNFDASDKTSGIAFYEIQIDGNEIISWKDDGTHIYQTPSLEAGDHSMTVRAIDQAGNFLTKIVDFNIEALEPPVIIEYSKELADQHVFIVKGKTYPNARVEIYIQRENYSPIVKNIQSDEFGNFIFTCEDKIAGGTYKMWALVINNWGVRSPITDKYIINVQSSFMSEFGTTIVRFLSVIIPFIALWLLLIALLWYGVHRLKMLRRRVRSEVGKNRKIVHLDIGILKRHINNHIISLERASKKRILTKEEKIILGQFRADINSLNRKAPKYKIF